ncbi:SET domain-containing protein [Taibaiella koreensis]|uniref:SET domain-containing protein n=1 Tax=Taibaiella koreensis TaxID=1268548 RepID=UPI000E59E0F7|nr:SET domain-containing protein-lysine N-methyltransferase [Taibaiella koreensis]
MAFFAKHLYIAPSTISGAGQGLFTNTFIPKGARIIEYTGKVTDWEHADHQEGLNAYIYFVNDDHVIDAAKRKKSLARYANDARGMKKIKGVNNNSEYIEEGNRVYVDAMKNIEPGSEILVGYGKEYWDVLKKNYADAAAGR